MNQKLFFAAACMACATFFGCERTEINRAESEFFVPAGFEADTSYFHYEGCVELRFTGNTYYSAGQGGSTKQRFKQYVYYFNDFGYREDEVWCFGCCDEDNEPYRPTSACVCDIKSVHIVTDNDFDEVHPAGSDADDLFTICLEAAYPYIKNGYEGYASRFHNNFTLNDIDPDYLKLNGLWFGALMLKKKPAQQGLYSFTVSIEMGADPVTGNIPNFEPQTFKLKF